MRLKKFIFGSCVFIGASVDAATDFGGVIQENEIGIKSSVMVDDDVFFKKKLNLLIFDPDLR